jgi:hypothetical protein
LLQYIKSYNRAFEKQAAIQIKRQRAIQIIATINRIKSVQWEMPENQKDFDSTFIFKDINLPNVQPAENNHRREKES